MKERKVEVIKVDVFDCTMTGGKYKSEYRGKVINDSSGMTHYVDTSGIAMWPVGEEIVDIMTGKPIHQHAVVDVEEVAQLILAQAPPQSLIESIGELPKKINIEF